MMASMAAQMCLGVSQTELSMRQFVEQYQDKLPVLVEVIDGHSGGDPKLHSFSSGDVYLIRKIKEQPRALLRDSDKRIVSVPLNHPAHWKIVKRGGGNEPGEYTMKDVAERFKKQCQEFSIIEKNDSSLRISGVDKESRKSLGRLRILYEKVEKYLVAHTMVYADKEKDNMMMDMLDNPVPVPLYMSITLAVVDRLLPPLNLSYTLQQIMDNFVPYYLPDIQLLVNEGVMFMPDHTGPYEYLTPYSKIPMPKTKRVPASPSSSQETPPPLPPFRQQSGDGGNKSPEVPSLPRPPNDPTTPPPLIKRSEPRGDILVKRPIPDIPKDSSTPDNDNLKNEEQDTKAHRPTPNRRQSKDNTYTPTPGGSVYQPITKSDKSDRQFTKVADIPTNLRPLTVNELSQCLTLIKIDEKIVKVFKDEAIDGELFCNLQEEQLASLDITPFKVRKLLLFRDKNWRPALGDP